MEENGASEFVWKERYSGSFDMEISGLLRDTQAAYLIRPHPLPYDPRTSNLFHSVTRSWSKIDREVVLLGFLAFVSSRGVGMFRERCPN